MATKAELEKQNAELLAKLDMLLEKNEQLSNQVFKLTKMLFGSRSEKTNMTTPDIPENQMSLFDKPSDFFVKSTEKEGEKETIVEKHLRKRRIRGWKEKQLENLPTEDFHHVLEDPTCECCGHGMNELGTKSWSEVVVIPAKLVRHVHHIHSYECRTCKKSGVNQIQSASSPNRILPGSIASASMIAESIYMKFGQFVPLERQLKDWHRLGLTLHSRTLVEWVNKVAIETLEPVYAALKMELLQHKIIAADETPYRVINRSDGKSGTSKAQNWVYRTTGNMANEIIVFDSTLTRGKQEISRFLDEWQGIILCDGYSVYRQLSGIELANCWVHARRKWYEALEAGGDNASPQVKLGKNVCDALFRMDRDWKKLSVTEQHQMRLMFMKPLLEDFFRWIGEVNASPKSLLGTAITYSLNQKEGLMKFLEIPGLPLDNNLSENAIRPLTLGRKNWLFSTSEQGAKANAIYLSLAETCKANKIDFRKYIEKLLIELPQINLNQNPTRVKEYMPWSPEIADFCKLPKNKHQIA